MPVEFVLSRHLPAYPIFGDGPAGASSWPSSGRGGQSPAVANRHRREVTTFAPIRTASPTPPERAASGDATTPSGPATPPTRHVSRYTSSGLDSIVPFTA